ncbi:GTPase Era [Pantoea sp. Aalb]|uniref:GTPase Era n=1 Tax=Pantoea sp. Aalb TaxID=2576762 RepID=UPI001328C83B|nr:GTPase Era [Pantoea sp. Aalb]MXP67245.1 GTPase Era [Pantoea sp. Aalb]
MSKFKNYCGFITIVGRSNVGKSTLLNQLLKHKVSITSQKHQTTRQSIIGIHTEGAYQAIYVDTPGLHTKGNRFVNRLVNRVATNTSSILDVNLVIFVVEGTRWILDDELMLNKLHYAKVPVILAINKVDTIREKNILLPHIKFISQKMNFFEVIPISAKTGKNVDKIIQFTHKCIPQANHLYPKTHITDSSLSFTASEIIREKLMRFLGAELPYSVNVEIHKFMFERKKGYNIYALIFVKSNGQKRIVIGNKGVKIKTIGIKSRKDMESIFKSKVSLKLLVKVKSKWIEY